MASRRHTLARLRTLQQALQCLILLRWWHPQRQCDTEPRRYTEHQTSVPRRERNNALPVGSSPPCNAPQAACIFSKYCNFSPSNITYRDHSQHSELALTDGNASCIRSNTTKFYCMPCTRVTDISKPRSSMTAFYVCPCIPVSLQCGQNVTHRSPWFKLSVTHVPSFVFPFCHSTSNPFHKKILKLNCTVTLLFCILSAHKDIRQCHSVDRPISWATVKLCPCDAAAGGTVSTGHAVDWMSKISMAAVVDTSSDDGLKPPATTTVEPLPVTAPPWWATDVAKLTHRCVAG
eukprot:m.729807 g.729807  ORF g.729807 m.729807 type:complete len:290 (+) comp23050_c0_seq42:645-1514(+)